MAIVGATGAGKSTLICSLLGAKLEAKKVGLSYKFENKSKGNYPAIGNDGNSCTTMATAYGNFIDTTGFMDTRGT